MQKYAQEFSQILQAENKEKAVEYALNLLKDEKVDVLSLYSEILLPSLNNMYCLLSEKDVCIWKEHVRTAIIRTTLECCYPYVIDMRNKKANSKKGTAVILCPPEEYQDLEARLISDYLTILGYNSIFVGSNTPYADFYNAADKIKPEIIVISVSNYYNLVATKKIIKELREKTLCKIMVCGYAFSANPDNVAMVGADYYVDKYDALKSIAERI